jgi:hypothetical protein
MTNENNRNAYAGRNIEFLVKSSIIDHPVAISKIKTHFNIKSGLENTALSGKYGDKSDVRINFVSGDYIGANVKGYKIGFNQLTRTSVANFCKLFNLNAQDTQDLKNIFIAKSSNTKNYLFSQANQTKWLLFIRNNARNFLKWGFSRHPSKEILVFYDRIESIVRIYPMRDVLRTLPINITWI